MIRIFALPVMTILAGLLVTVVVSDKDTKAYTYPEHLTGAFTGGFGEETCRSCHFDYELNPSEGSLSISGIGEEVSPGEVLEIQITVKRSDMDKAGFQLSARYADGRQAGEFNIENNRRVMFTQTAPDSLRYVQHSEKGTESAADGINSWTIRWSAPANARTPASILFNIAANAANGDASEFGDFIYAKEITITMKQD